MTSATDPLSTLEPEIVDHYFELRCTTAAALGRHEYDGRLPDLSTAATRRWSLVARELLGRVESVPTARLDRSRQLDRELLRLLLEGTLFELEETRDLDRNPMNFLGQAELTTYIARDYAPVEDRTRAIVRILAGVPDLLRTAEARLEARLPRPFVTLSLQIAEGLPSHFEEGEAFAAKGSPALAREVRKARDVATEAVRSFAQWLTSHRLPTATDDFALGPEKFQRLLWVREGLKTPVQEVMARGRDDLERNQQRLQEVARQQRSTPGELIARLSDEHPAPDQLVATARRMAEETREFVRANDLVTIPEPEICHVRETPPWARGLWTAAMNGPGPFEKPVDGIYWVTPVDPAWDPGRAEGWLRTLNHAMLKNTTIHEVWPGHYLQALHFRRPRQSLARQVWMSYSFMEGWAHYCEQLAVEAGLDGRSTAAEVIQIHDALLRDCRLIASIGMHTQGMSVAQATELLRTQAHLELVNAEREAIRGTYNPEYFCYTLGKLAILDARSKYLESSYRGSRRAFHDALLSYGSPPIGFLDGLLAGR